MPNLETLKTRLTSRQSTIAIVGLGYVGLPLLLRFSSVGLKVLKKLVSDPNFHQGNNWRSK